MGKLKNYLLATVCLVILVAALTLMGSLVVRQGQAVPLAKDVTVVNTSTNPVPVVVQNGDGDGTIIELVEFVRVNQTSTVDLFTVPMGQRLVITDVIVSGGSANGEILRDGTTVSFIRVESPVTYRHGYVSGIVFTEGQTLTVTVPAGDLNWELRGFLETLPSS